MTLGINIDDFKAAEIEKICAILLETKEENLNDPALRSESVASVASKIAVIPLVREAANTWMHACATHLDSAYNGLIVDGRDIGTVVFPKAQVKFYITADEEVRLKRRYAQNAEAKEKIQKIIQERDKRDSTRKTAPLEAAKDAHIIDTTDLSLDETCKIAAKYVSITLPVKYTSDSV